MKTLEASGGSGGAPKKGAISPHFWSLVANLGVPAPVVAVSATTAPVATADADRATRALDDLAAPSDPESGDRALTIRHEYLRDPKVRRRLVEAANGLCEYCRKPGFRKLNGERYLEAHHVISLADNGDDSVDNVIAVCPEHHREAHFGENGEALEQDFMKVIARRRGKL
nr:HNH endonuclease signature motif containing protein [Caballeronia sp. GAWG1-1]